MPSGTRWFVITMTPAFSKVSLAPRVYTSKYRSRLVQLHLRQLVQAFQFVEHLLKIQAVLRQYVDRAINGNQPDARLTLGPDVDVYLVPRPDLGSRQNSTATFVWVCGLRLRRAGSRLRPRLSAGPGTRAPGHRAP